MVSGYPRKCGKPRKDPDGRKRAQVSASIPAAANDTLQGWKAQLVEQNVGTRLGDVLTKALHFAKEKGFSPLD